MVLAELGVPGLEVGASQLWRAAGRCANDMLLQLLLLPRWLGLEEASSTISWAVGGWDVSIARLRSRQMSLPSVDACFFGNSVDRIAGRERCCRREEGRWCADGGGGLMRRFQEDCCVCFVKWKPAGVRVVEAVNSRSGWSFTSATPETARLRSRALRA